MTYRIFSPAGRWLTSIDLPGDHRHADALVVFADRQAKDYSSIHSLVQSGKQYIVARDPTRFDHHGTVKLVALSEAPMPQFVAEVVHDD